MAKAKKLYSIVNTKTHTHIAIPKQVNNSRTVQKPGRKVVVKNWGRAYRYHKYNRHKLATGASKAKYKAKIFDKGAKNYSSNLKYWKNLKKKAQAGG